MGRLVALPGNHGRRRDPSQLHSHLHFCPVPSHLYRSPQAVRPPPRGNDLPDHPRGLGDHRNHRLDPVRDGTGQRRLPLSDHGDGLGGRGDAGRFRRGGDGDDHEPLRTPQHRPGEPAGLLRFAGRFVPGGEALGGRHRLLAGNLDLRPLRDQFRAGLGFPPGIRRGAPALPGHPGILFPRRRPVYPGNGGA